MNPYVQWLVPVAVSVAALAYTILHNRRADWSKLSERVVVLETKMELFLKNMTVTMGNVLHSPHPDNARMDYLIERFEAETITLEEMKELIGKLRDITKPRHNKTTEQIAASFMLLGIEQQKDRQLFAEALSEIEH